MAKYSCRHPRQNAAPHEAAQSDALFEYLDSGGGHQQGNGARTLEQVDQGVLVTLGVDDAFGLQVCSPAVARAFATAKAALNLISSASPWRPRPVRSLHRSWQGGHSSEWNGGLFP